MKIRRKSVELIFATLAYLLIVVFINVVHNRYFNVNVVFYSALFDGLIAFLVFVVFRKWLTLSLELTRFEFNLFLCILLLVGYIYAISIPTVIDRSLSIYLLEKIYSQNGEMDASKIEEVIQNDYVHEHRLAAVRLTEQIESGTVEIIDGCVRLTTKGRVVATISKFAQLNLLPKKRLLLDNYTDALTNPINNNMYYPERNCIR